MATPTRERPAAAPTNSNRTIDTSRRVAFLTIVLANTLWAGTYTAGKVALGRLSPVELNALRFTLASLMLAPVLIRGWRKIPLDRRTLFTLVRLTLLGFVLNKAFEYVGLALSTASDVALLIATESLFTAFLSWTVLRERISRLGVAALLVGLAGAYLIVARGLVPQLDPGHADTRILGDVLVVLSLLIEAGYSVLGKSAVTTVPPLLFTAVTITGSLFVWIPAGLINVAHSGWPQMTLNTWLAVFYMAAIATVAGYWLWFRGASRSRWVYCRADALHSAAARCGARHLAIARQRHLGYTPRWRPDWRQPVARHARHTPPVVSIVPTYASTHSSRRTHAVT